MSEKVLIVCECFVQGWWSDSVCLIVAISWYRSMWRKAGILIWQNCFFNNEIFSISVKGSQDRDKRFLLKIIWFAKFYWNKLYQCQHPVNQILILFQNYMVQIWRFNYYDVLWQYSGTEHVVFSFADEFFVFPGRKLFNLVLLFCALLWRLEVYRRFVHHILCFIASLWLLPPSFL